MESKYISPGPEALWLLLSYVKWCNTPDNYLLLTSMSEQELEDGKSIVIFHNANEFINGINSSLWLDLFDFELERRANQKTIEIESKIAKAMAEIESYQIELKKLRGL